GAGGDAPDAQASALGLPYGQPQPPKRLSPSWDTTNHGGVQRELSQNFYGRSPVGAPGRVAGGHFRRAQPSQFAHGCAPTGERLRGYFFVGRNSFRFSVPLVPFQRANRSAGKKRNEF